MAWRGAGALLALAIVGAGGGYAAGHLLHPPATSTGAAEPLAAVSPSTPQDPKLRVLPDPDVPALLPGLPLTDAVLGTKQSGLHVLVPRGWVRGGDAIDVESIWAVPGNPINTYGLRVEIVASQHLTILATRDARVAALKSVTEDFKLESQTPDSMIASYVKDDYRRLTFHRWVTFQDPDPGHGQGQAYVEIAVTGRFVDRLGMQDLIDRVADSAHL